MSDESGKPRKRSLSRRAFLGALGAITLSVPLAAHEPAGSDGSKPKAKKKKAPPAKKGPVRKGPRVVVVGAGAFGGWTALELLRRGAQVTLVDAWGPGNSRASSGGETRVIRGVYGADRIYTEMAARAFKLWHENERRWNKTLYRRTGALWMLGDEGSYARAAMPILKEYGFAYEELTAAEAARRYPQIAFDGIRWAMVEKEAGYLLARRSCAEVVAGFVDEGGEYRVGLVQPSPLQDGRLPWVVLSEGGRLMADVYVFACGPWLPRIFPALLGDFIQPTRQEVFYFGTPAGDLRFDEDRFPVWVEVPRFFYGIPGNERRGFKIADDSRGPAFDPTDGDRVPTAEALASAREYLARRFPALAKAPVVEARVCQYENSPDHHFVIDRHPEASNVWILGGGSGHGFKHGPAVGEVAARGILGEKTPDPLFSFARRAARAASGVFLESEKVRMV